MYIRLWVHMHMGMGRRMHVSMYISNLTSHFRMATEVWSMYGMMGPLNRKGTVSGPFFNTLLTLQPLKLALELLYELIAACHLILQSGQAFTLGPDLICKAIRICGGGHGSKGGLCWSHGRGGHEAYAIEYTVPELGSGAPLVLHGELDLLQLCLHGGQLGLEGADGWIRWGRCKTGGRTGRGGG